MRQDELSNIDGTNKIYFDLFDYKDQDIIFEAAFDFCPHSINGIDNKFIVGAQLGTPMRNKIQFILRQYVFGDALFCMDGGVNNVRIQWNPQISYQIYIRESKNKCIVMIQGTRYQFNCGHNGNFFPFPRNYHFIAVSKGTSPGTFKNIRIKVSVDQQQMLPTYTDCVLQ